MALPKRTSEQVWSVYSGSIHIHPASCPVSSHPVVLLSASSNKSFQLLLILRLSNYPQGRVSVRIPIPLPSRSTQFPVRQLVNCTLSLCVTQSGHTGQLIYHIDINLLLQPYIRNGNFDEETGNHILVSSGTIGVYCWTKLSAVNVQPISPMKYHRIESTSQAIHCF